MRNRPSLLLYSFALGLAIFQTRLAQGQAYDVNVQSLAGRLATGSSASDAGPWAQEARVFVGEFPSLFYTDNPGWNALGAGSPLLPGDVEPLAPLTDLSWDYLPLKISGVAGNLFHWDGVGAVDFVPPPTADYQLSLRDRTGTFFSTTPDAGLVAGGAIVRTDSTGAVHKHQIFALDDFDGDLNTDPAGGVYLAAIRLEMTGFDRSKPAFLVFGTPTSTLSELQAAEAWTAAAADALAPDFASDADGDLLVDGADLSAWQSGFGAVGASALQSAGDFNFDDAVDGADFLAWQRQFGSSLATLSGAGQSVAGGNANLIAAPEPAAWQLVACGALLCGIWARRARRFPASTAGAAGNLTLPAAVASA